MPRSLPLLVFIDPALKEAGGHHAGFAEFIARSRRVRPARVIVYAHAKLNVATEQSLLSSGVRVRKHFSRDFYRIISEPLSTQQRLIEINALADELAAALTELGSGCNRSTATTLFYPSFGLEHLAALTSACYRNVGNEFRHLVCMMFRPGTTTRATLSELKRRGGYADKLQTLNSTHDLRLFASDWELAHSYADLCPHRELMHLHPIYLTTRGRRRRRLLFSRRKPRIMIFAGDAKDEKGFDRLPAIAKRLLHSNALTATVVIQYTSNWGNRSTAATEQVLRDLAAREPRLELHRGYWSDRVFRRQLGSLDLFIFSHRTDAYEHKSSGLLWLLGAFGIPLLFMEQSWLTREAERLELPVVAGESSLDDLDRLSPAAIRIAADRRPWGHYRTQLYAPFWPWLHAQMLNTSRSA